MIDLSSFSFIGGIAKDAETENLVLKASQSPEVKPDIEAETLELAKKVYKESGAGIKAMALKVHPLGSNMVELELGDTWILFSYSTPVAARIPGEGWFRTEQFHSVTTSRHINKWLGGRPAEPMPQEFFDTLADNVKTKSVETKQVEEVQAALKPFEGKTKEEVLKANFRARLVARLGIKAGDVELVEDREEDAGAPGYMKLEGLGAGYGYYDSISREALTESNHAVAVEELKGAADSPEGVIVSGGDIFVKADDAGAMAKAKEIISDLDGYPVLSDDHFSQKEWDLVEEAIDSYMLRDLEHALGWGLDGEEFMEKAASDETHDLFNQVPEANQKELLDEITATIEAYPDEAVLRHFLHDVYGYSGELYVPEADDFSHIASSGSGEAPESADESVQILIKDFLASNDPGSAKRMREKEELGQQRLPLEPAKLKAAEVKEGTETEAEPKAETAPVEKVTDEKPITEIKELKPKKTSIDLARAAKVLPEVVVGLLNHIQEDEAYIAKQNARLDKITKALRTRKDSREAKRVERLALLARELKDLENRMGRVLQGAEEYALQWDPGTESTTKVLERQWDPEALAKVADIKKSSEDLRATLKVLDKEASDIEKNQPVTKEVIQPRILKFPLKSAKVVAGILDSMAGFVKKLAELVRGPVNEYNKGLDQLEEMFAA